jgi:hypothetical protein
MPEGGEAIRRHFIGWQCRIRQIATRQHGGRPTAGMRPRIIAASGEEIAPAVTVLILERDPADSTAFFREQVRKAIDPRIAYERGLAHLQAEYFQEPDAFSGRLAAIFPAGSPVAARLLGGATCILEFDQFRQSYRLPAAVREFLPGEPDREAAIWHNRIFNPALPDNLQALAFQPDWENAEARPGP